MKLVGTFRTRSEYMYAAIRKRIPEKILRLGTVLLLSLPVVLFFLPFLLGLHRQLPGDWDYFAQLYESTRRIILVYHQFPWWNPWQAGGVPLYANPQFGLFSIQLPLVIVFGTLPGLRLGVVLYFLVGFWGMMTLLKQLKTPRLRGLLLSYVWVFSGYTIWHMLVGHYTFCLYMLSPWLLWAFLRKTNRLGWLWFGAVSGLYIGSSPHNTAVQALALLGLVAIVELMATTNRRSLLTSYARSFPVTALFIIHRLYYVLQYTKQYPRIPESEITNSGFLLLQSLWRPGLSSFFGLPTMSLPRYNWWEYAAYMGVLTLIIILLSVLLLARNWKINKNWRALEALGIAVICLTLALGPVWHYSPYTILTSLPVFKLMRVPSRWIGWAGFALVIFIGLSKYGQRFERWLRIALMITVVELFITHTVLLASVHLQPFDQPASGSFKLIENYSAPSLMPLLGATYSNESTLKGYEPILGDVPHLPTKRCSTSPSCPLVLTNNAQVVSWTPNKIILRRTGDGKILLDINPGSYWLINGTRAFANYRITELDKDFIIEDQSNLIVCQISPRKKFGVI
jgi:putative Mn2+ efflux pump MntP